jgi:hypothetical protein
VKSAPPPPEPPALVAPVVIAPPEPVEDVPDAGKVDPSAGRTGTRKKPAERRP